MNAEKWAMYLNGREYRDELSAEEEADAKADGVLIIFGASDDLMELRGIISDEMGACDGGDFLLTNRECIEREHECDCEFCGFSPDGMARVEAVWCDDNDYSWTYRVTVPHFTFDIVEGDTKYCRGVVIDKSVLAVAQKRKAAK